MPKSSDQKLKILYVMRFLLEETDEAHPASMEQIISELASRDIAAERKGIYSDVETLRRFGLDICMSKGKPGGYYVLNRDFELAELKLLLDAVQASQFITEKKSLQLIRKLEKLCSVHEAQNLGRQLYVKGRVKNMNESIYYNVDAIHRGIAEDRQIEFRYFSYGANKRKMYRRNGGDYCISPFALTWDNENYYMIGFDAAAGALRHYRVDRMEHIRLAQAPRQGGAVFAQCDMRVYTKRNFSMFGGEELRVTMEFENALAGVVIDRFGKDAPMFPTDDSHFRLSAPVVVSPQFYGWIFGLGAGVRILEPEQVAAGMREQLAQVAARYGQTGEQAKI